MAKYKGVKWAQVLTLMSAIAQSLESTFAKKSDLVKFVSPHFEDKSLVFPAESSAHFEEKALVLSE